MTEICHDGLAELHSHETLLLRFTLFDDGDVSCETTMDSPSYTYVRLPNICFNTLSVATPVPEAAIQEISESWAVKNERSQDHMRCRPSVATHFMEELVRFNENVNQPTPSGQSLCQSCSKLDIF